MLHLFVYLNLIIVVLFVFSNTTYSANNDADTSIELLADNQPQGTNFWNCFNCIRRPVRACYGCIRRPVSNCYGWCYEHPHLVTVFLGGLVAATTIILYSKDGDKQKNLFNCLNALSALSTIISNCSNVR